MSLAGRALLSVFQIIVLAIIMMNIADNSIVWWHGLIAFLIVAAPCELFISWDNERELRRKIDEERGIAE